MNEMRIDLGRLRVSPLDNAHGTVEEIMESGPTTVRPVEPLAPLVGRMNKRGVPHILVTTSEGVLRGILRRDDAAERLAELGAG
ncbi:MAG: CBS domain-containing protein [Actinomycetota bacterium]